MNLHAPSTAYMRGTAAAQFSPNIPLTRAMIVTILYRHAGSPDNSQFTIHDSQFDDVAGDTWYSDAVLWAAENGIVSGYGGGLFGPDDNITRQDLAVILMRYATLTEYSLPEIREYQSFTDESDIAGYARESVEAFFRAGIINGKGDGIFDPLGQATRAEVAAMLHRFLAL